jgi:dTDP-4-amino-4,6-dideoxygalactose transaminase
MSPADVSFDRLANQFHSTEPVYVTRPRLPSLDDYVKHLRRVWDSHWLTNDGALHDELRAGLETYLGVEHLSLCCNGTVALLLSLQAARINGGEVITTPFTFPATPHSLYWNRVRPVFCDVSEDTFNIDPEKIEGLISAETRAILGVHVFGNPCETEAIETIARTHGLAVIYDAAHAMGVTRGGRSVLSYGDFSVLSFHATKLFSTAEGGAIISSTRARRERVDSLKNFGIVDEETVIGPGINGKLNELQAGLGLLLLETLDAEIAARARLVATYRRLLAPVEGIRFQEDLPDTGHNYSYFPILVDPDEYGLDRDQLTAALNRCNIHPRKYFYPLCSTYPCYASLPSSQRELLPVATRISERILCLPLYGELDEKVVETVCTIIAFLQGGG